MMVEQYELAVDSGGPGRHRGGLGIVRQYRVLTDDIRVRTKGDRNLIAPWGLQGGLSGGRCRVVRNPGTPAEQEITPKEYDILLKAGESILFITPGAGGYGPPGERTQADILRDVQEGKLSPRVAAEAYALSPKQLRDAAS
jgi:N-methylhydantoinase B